MFLLVIVVYYSGDFKGGYVFFSVCVLRGEGLEVYISLKRVLVLKIFVIDVI